MIKGSKRDKFSTPEMLTLLEKSRTYSTGSELMRLKCSDDWWSKVLRKSVNLEYVDINFNITRCDSFNRVWRQYKVSEKGKEFLRRPRNDLVLDSAVDPFNEEKKEKAAKTYSHMSNTPDLSRVTFTSRRIESYCDRNRKWPYSA